MMESVNVDPDTFDRVFPLFSFLLLTYMFYYLLSKLDFYTFLVRIVTSIIVSGALILYRYEIMNIINFLRKYKRID